MKMENNNMASTNYFDMNMLTDESWSLMLWLWHLYGGIC